MDSSGVFGWLKNTKARSSDSRSIGVETEAADVEAQPGAGDLHTYVQIRSCGRSQILAL